MKHRILTVMLLSLALLLTACHQVTPPATEPSGITEPSGTTGSSHLSHTHSYTAAEVVDGSCTEDGYTMMRCDCGAYYRENIVKAPGHDYKTQIVEPTATEKGYTLYTCKRCGYSHKVIPAWYPAPRQYMSYDEFFSQVKTLNYYNFWLAPYEDGFKTYSASQRDEGIIVTEGGNTIHTVPGSETYGDHTKYCFIGSDGFYAYLFSETELFRLDMLTGEKTTLAQYDRVHHTTRNSCFHMYSRDLIYFAAVVGDKITINRIYLPTGQLDVLNDDLPASIPEGRFTFSPYITIDADTISWSSMNPELSAVLQQELKNPDSIYKAGYAEFWEDPSLLENSWMVENLDPLFYRLQEATGIPGAMSVTLNLSDMSTEVKYAKYTTPTYEDRGHVDIYDPVAYDPIPPQWIMSDPVAIPQLIIPENAEAMYELPEYTIQQYGTSWCSDTGEETLYVAAQNGIYYPYGNYPENVEVQIPTHSSFRLEGNRVIQLLPDGSGKQVIYTAQYGELQRCYFWKGYLMIWDGDYLLRIDVPAKTIQTVLTAPYIMKYPSFFGDCIEIQTSHGLTYRRYICHIDTGEIEEFTTPLG